MRANAAVEFRNLTKKKIGFGDFEKLYNIIFPSGRQSGRQSFRLSVVFASSALMMQLNSKYRNKQASANVLSFLLNKNNGEIFLNIKEKNLPRLFLHGCLHLLGYTHKKNIDAEKMESLESKILNNLKNKNLE